MARVENRSRAWCLTINNYTAEDVLALKGLNYTYIIIGDEKGQNNTPHLQIYIEFKNQVKFTTLKNQLPTAHIESRRGTSEQAANYCKKESVLFQDGELSRQGKRTDISAPVEMLQEKRSMKRVAQEYPEQFVKYHKGFRALQSMLIDKRTEPPEVIVLYGPTGTGKSKKARELAGDDYYCWAPQCGQWFDGYEGQQITIMEEFRGQLPLGFMLSLLDRYECPVQYKGGIIQFNSTKIIITSPKHPEEWYQNDGSDKIDQLLRRITKIEFMHKPAEDFPAVSEVSEVAG